MQQKDTFEASYKQLNTRQKEAVDAINGPVLVVAGPGTGKTQLLSMRVANILRKTDTDPKNILCLTFTNKAAVNMRERLITLTNGEARDVMVKTFHSFAAELMNMYPDYFWNGAKLTTAPDAIQIEVIQDILSKLPLDNPLALKFAGTYTAGKEVKNALKFVKEAGLTPKNLEALIQANLAYIDIIEPLVTDILSENLNFKKLRSLQERVNQLPNQGITPGLLPMQDLGMLIKSSLEFAIKQDQPTGKTKHTGEWKKRFIQTVAGKKAMHDERARNIWWLSLAGVYASYRDALHLRGFYDYSDMIVEVISQLQKNPQMRADAQERFLYVLIDEFQDTNAAQLQLAHLIADHHVSDGNPNLMAVGDDDQSIYKFNGAELNNLLLFKSSYPQTKLIVLEDNYRSSQAVLHTAKKIIEQADDRLVNRESGITKNLIARNEPDRDGLLVHYQYPTEAHELHDIAHKVASEYRTGNSSIAILARDHASLMKLSSLLLYLDIPVSYEKQSNILDNPAIQQVHIIGCTILAIQQGAIDLVNQYLSILLRAPMWNLKSQLLWEIAINNSRNGNWLDYLSKAPQKKLQNIAQWLHWLATEASYEQLPVLLEYIIGLRDSEYMESPLREYYIGGDQELSTDYMESLSALRILIEVANEYARTAKAGLREFVNFVQLSMDSGETIADETSFVTSNKAVSLLTVHKAKGLEFDTVYIINLIENNWKPRAAGRKPPANLSLQPVGDDADDFIRLLYVAATRAKRSLITASYSENILGKEIVTSPFIHDVLPKQELTAEQVGTPITVLEEHLSWPRLNSVDEKNILHDQLENFVLSASAYLDFLDVSKGGPRKFLENHLLCLPTTSTTNMAFGTAIHRALEFAQIITNNDTFQINKILQQFEKALREQYLSVHDFERFLDNGNNIIKQLFKSDTFWMPKGGLPEQKLYDIKVGNADVKGTIDRINIFKSEAVIVDYKTGSPLQSFTTKSQNKAIKAWRHRSQLAFYTLLLKNSPRFRANTFRGQMWYVEASTARELIREYIPTDEALDRMTQLIQVIWKKIKQLELPDSSIYSKDIDGIYRFEQDLLDGKV